MKVIALAVAVIGLAIASVALGIALSASQATGHTGRCSVPDRLPSGAYSSHSASQGHSMPSGQSVTLADGDVWSCSNGQVTVH